MEKTGLIAKMTTAVSFIVKGRRGLETDGEEHEGMVAFVKGIAIATEIYTEVMHSGDPELMLMAEYTYMSQELEHAEADENGAEASAAAAVQSFDDALLALKAVADPAMYKGVELALPHRGKWRYKSLPRDAFHVACIAHKTRIKNGISRFGVNRRDRSLAELRIVVFAAAQQVYCAKQSAILGESRSAITKD